VQWITQNSSMAESSSLAVAVGGLGTRGLFGHRLARTATHGRCRFSSLRFKAAPPPGKPRSGLASRLQPADRRGSPPASTCTGPAGCRRVGNVLARSGPLADLNRLRFASKEAHDPSGLVNFGRRFYSPHLQRWINRDPLGPVNGPNLFAYVGNNPVNAVDPWGC
jgi:RHS repeat-associated protein